MHSMIVSDICFLKEMWTHLFFLFWSCNSTEKLWIIKIKMNKKNYQNQLVASSRTQTLKFDKMWKNFIFVIIFFNFWIRCFRNVIVCNVFTSALKHCVSIWFRSVDIFLSRTSPKICQNNEKVNEDGLVH